MEKMMMSSRQSFNLLAFIVGALMNVVFGEELGIECFLCSLPGALFLGRTSFRRK